MTRESRRGVRLVLGLDVVICVWICLGLEVRFCCVCFGVVLSDWDVNICYSIYGLNFVVKLFFKILL